MPFRPIIQPRPFKRNGQSRQTMTGGDIGYLDNHGAAPYIAGSFVKLTAGKLNPVVTTTAATDQACGWSFDASAAAVAAQSNPPYTFNNSSAGLRHFPLALDNMLWLMSVTDSAGNNGNAATACEVQDLTIGAIYGLKRDLTNYSQYQALNISVTTAAAGACLQLVEIPLTIDGEANGNTPTMCNPWVVVRFIPVNIQSV